MSDDYLNRGDNFLETMKRSIDSGTTINWSMLTQQLRELFYTTHRDGVQSGEQLGKMRAAENTMMERALDRLLEMGAVLARRKKAGHKVKALEDLESELTACFREVVIDSLDLSGKKLDRIMEKFIRKLGDLTDDLKAQAAVEEEE
jgi:hypothetical protein